MGAEQVYCVYEGNELKAVLLNREDAVQRLEKLKESSGGHFSILTRYLEDPIETQYKRWNLAQKSLEKGHENDYGKMLDESPRVFAGRAEQEALDYFDYEKAVKVAYQQNWTYRNQTITVKMLIEDAIQICQALSQPGVVTYQLGKLKGYKVPVYDEEDKLTQDYEIHLLFFVESSEGESYNDSEDC